MRTRPPLQDYIPKQSTRKYMFIFAHVFAGALLGLLFWHLTSDRRALPLCIAGSVLPDVIDKSLGLLFPSVLGAGRTVFHSLMIVGVVVLCILLVFRSRSAMSGVELASAFLMHQVLDEMWDLPVNWFWPLLGPFQGQMIPDYFSTYFWFEITNPSEWMFMIGSLVILARSYKGKMFIPKTALPLKLKTAACVVVVAVFLCSGLYLLAAGLTDTSATFIAPRYSQVPTVFAGLLALCGTVVMIREMVRLRHVVL